MPPGALEFVANVIILLHERETDGLTPAQKEERRHGPIASDDTDAEQAAGPLFLGLYAMSASRYLHEHDLEREDVGP